MGVEQECCCWRGGGCEGESMRMDTAERLGRQSSVEPVDLGLAYQRIVFVLKRLSSSVSYGLLKVCQELRKQRYEAIYTSTHCNSK